MFNWDDKPQTKKQIMIRVQEEKHLQPKGLLHFLTWYRVLLWRRLTAAVDLLQIST